MDDAAVHDGSGGGRGVIVKKCVWQALSAAFSIAALGYVAWTIRSTNLVDDFAWRDPRLWGVTGLAGLVYGLSLLLVAAGWLILLRGAMRGRSPPLPVHTGLSIYGISQLYKYLPTNVLHYVGRHAALRRLGVAHSVAAIGMLGEMVLLAPAALLVAALGGYIALSQIDGRVTQLLFGVLALGGLALAALRFTLPLLARFRSTARLARTLTSARMRGAALRAFGCYLLFFVASGGAFAVIAQWVGPWQLGDAPLLAAVWAGCWVLGFVTPGAPAGVGVREALLIATLGATGGIEGAALVALAMRVATLIGDLLLAVVGYAMRAAATLQSN